MKLLRRWKPLLLPGILLAAVLAGCQGSAVTGGGNGTTAVTVTVGGGGSSTASATASSRAMVRPLGTTIPSTVTAIRFTISGADIGDIVQTVPTSGGTLIVTLQVPSGLARTILVEAIDSDGISHFRGVTVIDASGVPQSVAIGMAIDTSNPGLRTWTLVDNSASSTLTRVVEGDGILVTGGAGGEILSSLDGISWTSIPTGKLDLTVNGLAFGNGTFLVMNATADTSPTYTNHFFSATSGNVTDWVASGSVVTDNPLASLAFGAGTFVAVGDNNAFYSQDNGTTWSPGTISGVSSLSEVVYGNGRFVAIDIYNDNVAVSTDGVVWTTSPLGLSLSSSLRGIRFGGGLFLFAAADGNVYTSADGVAWQQRTPLDFGSISEPNVSSVASGAGGFLVVVNYSWVYFTFDQGENWISVDLGAQGSIYDGTYFNDAFLLVGYDWGSSRGGVFRSGEL